MTVDDPHPGPDESDNGEDGSRSTAEQVAEETRVGRRVIRVQADDARELIRDDAVAARIAIEDAAAIAAAVVAANAEQATQATQSIAHAQKRTKNTIIILAVSVLIMVIVGLAVGLFLLARSDDIKDVQNRIENRVDQTERTFCAYMEQRAGIAATPSDKLLADQARILIRRLGCEPGV